MEHVCERLEHELLNARAPLHVDDTLFNILNVHDLTWASPAS
jgi:hypothetical protein